MDWFYYNDNGEKIGPISVAVLRELVKAGIIKRNTIIENVSGRSAIASNVKGIDFPVQTKPTSVDIPMPTQPQPKVTPVSRNRYETVEFKAHPDWFWGFIVRHLFCGLLFIIGLAIFAFPTPDANEEQAPLIPVILLLCIMLLQLKVWLIVFSTKLTITNKKIIFRRGILVRSEVELLHSDIRSVVIHQEILQRIFGIGTVAVATAATSFAAGITARNFRHPDKIKRIIQQHQRE